MSSTRTMKFVHVGEYAAEIPVELVDDGTGWSPYISVDDALRIDEVRMSLERGDLQAAGALAKVYHLTPVS